MGIKNMLAQKGLKIIDKTIGKKYPIVDDITDIFQGAEARIDDLEKEVTDLKNKLKTLEQYVQELAKGGC
jgi:wobble nucleotide-excising tRNase|tara:strand:+ start:168 stop:377 length:210 start_codon:yes stop_codon:yes gene_type:complete